MRDFRFHVKFYIKRTRLNSKGLTPINIQIKLYRQCISFSSSIDIDPTLWNSETQRIIGGKKLAREINSSLGAIEVDLHKLYHQMTMKEDTISITRLRDIFLGKESLEKKYFLIDLFDKLIAEKQQSAKSKKIKKASADSYFCTKEKLTDYLKLAYRTADIDMKLINYEFVQGFQVFLVSEGDCKHNTMIRHMRRLKQVTTDAYKNLYITRDPFTDITLSVKKANPRFLTEEELKRLITQKFENSTLGKIRDLFLFCCYTGLSYTDLESLRYSDIIDDAIMDSRNKTDNAFFIPLLPIPLAIINKYRNKSKNVFDVPSNQNMNTHLKLIAKICKIQRNLSSHVARHK